LDTATRRTFDKVDAESLKGRMQTHVVGDERNVYLVMSQRRRNSFYSRSQNLPSLQVNGTVIGFDRETGKRLWTQKVENQSLVLTQFSSSPVLIFSSRTYVRQNPSHWRLDLLALDKRSGKRLIDLSEPFNNDFVAMTVNLADRFVELRSYNQKYRFVAIEEESADGTDAAEPPATGGAPGESSPGDGESDEAARDAVPVEESGVES
jgi:hypothetical protein